MIVIADEIGKVVQAMRNGGYYESYYEPQYEAGADGSPYYMYGHRLEIADRLTKKEQDPIKKKQRYPLIALKFDIAEVKRDGVSDFKLNIVIATKSDANSNAEQRMTNVFKPILYPLYEKFILKFCNSGLFFWDGDLTIPDHIKIDRPYWGTEAKEGNLKNIFNDPVDAIEIVDLKFSMRDKNCLTL